MFSHITKWFRFNCWIFVIHYRCIFNWFKWVSVVFLNQRVTILVVSKINLKLPKKWVLLCLTQINTHTNGNLKINLSMLVCQYFPGFSSHASLIAQILTWFSCCSILHSLFSSCSLFSSLLSSLNINRDGFNYLNNINSVSVSLKRS